MVSLPHGHSNEDAGPDRNDWRGIGMSLDQALNLGSSTFNRDLMPGHSQVCESKRQDRSTSVRAANRGILEFSGRFLSPILAEVVEQVYVKAKCKLDALLVKHDNTSMSIRPTTDDFPENSIVVEIEGVIGLPEIAIYPSNPGFPGEGLFLLQIYKWCENR